MNRTGWLRFEGPGEVLRRRVPLLVGSGLLFATSLVLAQIGAPRWGALVEQGLASWLLGAFVWGGYRKSVKGVVHADTLGLRVGSAVIAERSRIAAAFLLAPESPVVRIALHRALSIDVKLETEEQARALLTALGLGPGEAIASFSALYGSHGFLAVALGGGGTLVAVAAAALQHRGGMVSALCAVLLGVTTLVLFQRLRGRVDVGSDGILLRRLGQQRFLAYASVASVVAEGQSSIVLRLNGGPDVRLTMAETAHVRDVLVQRIEEARSAFASDAGNVNATALVAPGGRDAERWLREVRALARAQDYRETRLDEEQLWRVVDDATAPPATRAGAALAIASLDEPARARLRVAADACAEPKLRVALTRVAEGAPDAELEEALAPLLESQG